MFEALVNQYQTMSLGEEIYTICFTAFLVGGALCCFRRSGKSSALAIAASRPVEKPRPFCRRRRPARIRMSPRAPRPDFQRRAPVPAPQNDNRAAA